jgi:flagellar protein FliO/FliZ
MLAIAEQATKISSDFSGSAYLMQLTVGLIIVLLGVVALAWLMKRMSGIQRSASGNIRVLEGLAIGPRERIVLIQAGEEQLLIGIAPGNIHKLHVMEHHIDSSNTTDSASMPFAMRLAEALNKRHQK